MASQPAPNSHPLGSDLLGSHGADSDDAHQPHEPIDAHEHGQGHGHGHGSHGHSHGLSPGGAFRWSILLNSLLTGPATRDWPGLRVPGAGGGCPARMGPQQFNNSLNCPPAPTGANHWR